MNRRQFIKNTSLLSGAVVLQPNLLWSNSHAPNLFELPNLPYEYNALEPHFDAQTMQIHHGKHHAAYVKNLNEAIVGTPFAKMGLEDILARVTDKYPKIRNNAGGHYNHSFFWKTLSPTKTSPSGALYDALCAQFGTIGDFQQAFSEKAKSLFGSGWTWLCFDKKKGFMLENTPNQDNPLMKKITKFAAQPILGLDVWEHAYYLKYQNRRADYIQAFWNVVNWQAVAQNYENALKK